MRFVRGTKILEISTRADYNSPTRRELVQVMERSASGVVYVEDYSVEIMRREYVFTDMPEGEYLALLDFFILTAEGAKNVIRVIDDYGDDYQGRFAQSEITFAQTSYEYWAGKFTVERVA